MHLLIKWSIIFLISLLIDFKVVECRKSVGRGGSASRGDASSGGFSGGGGSSGTGGGFDDDDIFSMLNGGMGGGGFRSRPRGGPQAQRKRAPTPEPTVIEKDLPVTLEEIFNGVTKKVTTKSKSFDPSGKLTTREVILEAKIKPGLRNGSKIKYKNFGDSEEGGRQDMHLIVKEQKHDYFTRVGDNLVVNVDLTLKEALTGWERIVRTIDGKSIRVQKLSPGPTQPGHEEHYPGLGMVISSKPGERGDLVVRANVKFPTTLSTATQDILKDILP